MPHQHWPQGIGQDGRSPEDQHAHAICIVKAPADVVATTNQCHMMEVNAKRPGIQWLLRNLICIIPDAPWAVALEKLPKGKRNKDTSSWPEDPP